MLEHPARRLPATERAGELTAMLGALLALLSAATFGLNNATLRRGVLSGSVLQALSITVPLGALLFALVALIAGALPLALDFSAGGIAWLAAAGIIHFAIGRYGNYRATRAMGANLSGPVQQASVLVSLGLAIAFLGETLTLLKMAGIVLVVAGPIVMLGRRGRAGRTTPTSGFVPNYVEGYAYSALCALGYGISPLFIRIGLEGGGLKAGLAGGTISYVAATAVIVAILLLPSNAANLRAPDRIAARWFVASGVFVFLSQMCRYMALAVAPVSVVVPIQRLSIVFRALFSWMLNRDHEVFGLRVVFGIGLSLIGVLALTASTEFLLALVPLPDAAAEFARWRWPGG